MGVGGNPAFSTTSRGEKPAFSITLSMVGRDGVSRGNRDGRILCDLMCSPHHMHVPPPPRPPIALSPGTLVLLVRLCLARSGICHQTPCLSTSHYPPCLSAFPAPRGPLRAAAACPRQRSPSPQQRKPGLGKELGDRSLM